MYWARVVGNVLDAAVSATCAGVVVYCFKGDTNSVALAVAISASVSLAASRIVDATRIVDERRKGERT